MTGLLVSVRDAEEARQALAGGADVIDIKEPRRGALGSADPATWHDVRRAIPADFPLSVALGELTETEIIHRARQVPDIQYAKVGLANCLDQEDWRQRWQLVMEQLPSKTNCVAVGYADHVAARAPSPSDVLRAAASANCKTLLLDTFTKDRGDLFGHFSDDQLAKLASECRDAGITLVLAGSLQLTTIERALSFAPALVAVRGAACIGDRTDNVCAELVKRIKSRISANSKCDLISK